MRKINEIFYSIQGEGHHTGVPAVFIRFSGCNLKCAFCDTDFESGTMMSDEDIIAEVLKYPQSHLIVLTGGEPSLFIDEGFIAQLKDATSMMIAIETNGTHTLPSNLDWVTFSPKSAFEGGNLQPAILTNCNELKVVYSGQPLDGYFDIEADYYYLQPCGTSNIIMDRVNIQRTFQVVLADPRWTLSLQTHKLIGVR